MTWEPCSQATLPAQQHRPQTAKAAAEKFLTKELGPGGWIQNKCLPHPQSKEARGSRSELSEQPSLFINLLHPREQFSERVKFLTTQRVGGGGEESQWEI